MRFGLILICLSFMTTALADEAVQQRNGPYLGVKPGMRDAAPNTELRGPSDADNALTWVGFDMTAPGGRVFLQTTDTAEYQVIPTSEEIVIIKIKNCGLNWKNDGHHLDTSFFAESVVKSVQATPKKGTSDLIIRIKLKKASAYDLRQEGSYLYIEFVKGN